MSKLIILICIFGGYMPAILLSALNVMSPMINLENKFALFG